MDISKMTKVDKSLPLADRIAFLKHCADLYETNGTSPLSDFEYDDEYYDLEALAPDDPFFDTVGGIADEHIYGTTVKHDIMMGSLNKSPDIESFGIWLKSTYSASESFILEHKIDGLSLGLTYENGELIRAATRGDGTVGIDVTQNALHVNGVVKNIPYTGRVEVRGECYKDRSDFYKNWHHKGFKNPRNFASGSLNQLDHKVTKERGLDFVAYEVVQKDFDTEFEKNAFLEKMGFNTLKDSTKRTKEGIFLDQIVKAVSVYMNGIKRNELPYSIDGIVVKLNNIAKSKSMGTTAGGRKAKANRAVKFPPMEVETTLIAIESNIGRTGHLTPVAILDPVDLDGSIISRATLHNFGALQGANAIKIGARVIIAKKGDIIPQIIRIKQNGTKAIDMPTVCPSCGADLKWDSVELTCDNINCVGQLVKKIVHWFDKIGVKGVKGGTLARLTDTNELIWEGKGIIESLPEMYYMLDNDRRSEHPFRKYAYLKEYFGEKKYQNMLDSVKSVKEVTLVTFIEALGIGRVGRTAADIVAIAPTIDDIDRLTVADVAAIPGFATKKAEGFLDGWQAVRKEIDQLLKYVQIKAENKTSDKLKDKTFCFTGSFDTPTRKEMELMVPDNGGKLSSVSKALTALVWDGSTMKGKYEKASQLGVNIITQNDFMAMLK